MCKLKYFWIFFVLFSVHSAFSSSCMDIVNPLKRIFSARDTEKILKTLGFFPHYTNYFDSAVQLVKLKKRWIAKGVKPEDTYIPYFAKNIEVHVEEIREGIKASSLSDFENLQDWKHLKFWKKKLSSGKKLVK